MAEPTTFIKLDRNMLNWRWYKDKNTLIVFLTLLFEANIADREFGQETIHRGEVVITYDKLSVITGLTRSQTRTALEHLILTGEIAGRIRPKYQVITIVNYDRYQGKIAGSVAGKSQANRRQIAPKSHHYKNNKNNKNDKKERIPPKSPIGGTSRPSGRERYPCGLSDKPDWMTDEEWDTARYMTADDIPGLYRGDYDSVIDYLLAKKEGALD